MLRTLPVDPAPLNLVSAGTPEALMIWGEENGRRVITDRQETDSHTAQCDPGCTRHTGRKLWTCYLMSSSAERPELISVRVPADHQPVLSQFGPVTLVGLEVNVRVGRDGKLAQYWAASEVRDAAGNRRDKPQDAAA